MILFSLCGHIAFSCDFDPREAAWCPSALLVTWLCHGTCSWVDIFYLAIRLIDLGYSSWRTLSACSEGLTSFFLWHRCGQKGNYGTSVQKTPTENRGNREMSKAFLLSSSSSSIDGSRDPSLDNPQPACGSLFSVLWGWGHDIKVAKCLCTVEQVMKERWDCGE